MSFIGRPRQPCFDDAQNQYVDLVEVGMIDPTKVVCIALENAVSVASVLLPTVATMTEAPDTTKPPPPETDMAI